MIASRPTILHVEDNLGDKELLEHACQKGEVDWNLRWVEDGQVAVDYLSGTAGFADRNLFPVPNLVLLDLKMPRKNGFEVLEWLRSQPALKWMPVVVFSASNSFKDTRRVFELGANSLIVKPTSYRDLVAYVQAIDRYWFRLNHCPSPELVPMFPFD